MFVYLTWFDNGQIVTSFTRNSLALGLLSKMYQAHKARIPQAMQQQQAAARRHPLASAGNNPVNHQHTPPKSLPKAPPSPPLPRQNSKTAPPSPPKIITDKTGRFHFNRVGFLGEVSLLNLCFILVVNFVLSREVLLASMRSRMQEARDTLVR